MYPQRKWGYKSTVRRIERPIPNGLPMYTRNSRQWGPTWIASVIVWKVGDVMYEIDVRGKCLTRYVNRIHYRRLDWNKEPPSSNLPLDYLVDTISLERQDQCRRIDGQNPRRSWRRHIPQRLQLNPRSKTYISRGKGGMVSQSEVV